MHSQKAEEQHVWKVQQSTGTWTKKIIGGKRFFLCGSNQPETYASLCVKESLSVNVYERGRRPVITVCMFMCLFVGNGSDGGGCRGQLGMKPDGDCRAIESGYCLVIHSIILPHVLLPISAAVDPGHWV